MLILLQVIGVFVKRHIPPRFTVRSDGLFEIDLVIHESASSDLRFPLHCLQFHFFLWRCNALFHRDRLVCHSAAGRGVSFRQLFTCVFQFFRCRRLYSFFPGNHLRTPLAGNLDVRYCLSGYSQPRMFKAAHKEVLTRSSNLMTMPSCLSSISLDVSTSVPA